MQPLIGSTCCNLSFLSTWKFTGNNLQWNHLCCTCILVCKVCCEACSVIPPSSSSLASVQGLWWYRSGKYTAANIVLDTQRVFFYFLTRMNTVPIKRESAQCLCAYVGCFKCQGSHCLKWAEWNYQRVLTHSYVHRSEIGV